MVTQISKSSASFYDINKILGNFESFQMQFKLFNLFEFNYEFLFFLLSVCFSYAIVLIQFEIEAENQQKVNIF